MKPLVFVSHSSKDRPEVEKLLETLEQFGIGTWVSFKDIPPGDEWDQAIETALHRATHIILIASKNSSESSYVRAEVEYALSEKKKVIPLIIDDCTLPPRWHTLQSVFLIGITDEEYNKRLQGMSFQLPKKDETQLYTELYETRNAGKVKQILLNNRDWFSARLACVNVSLGSQIDMFSASQHSSANVAVCTYLLSPFIKPFDGNSIHSELKSKFEEIKHHIVSLNELDEDHLLYPSEFPDRGSRFGETPGPFYLDYRIHIFVGMRDFYDVQAGEARAVTTSLMEEECKEILRNSIERRTGKLPAFHRVNIEIPTYDRLFDMIKARAAHNQQLWDMQIQFSKWAKKAKSTNEDDS